MDKEKLRELTKGTVSGRHPCKRQNFWKKFFRVKRKSEKGEIECLKKKHV